MVLPVIPIALMAAARFIAKKGITAAIKKFGKKTVTEAKKHVKDVTTAVRPGVKQTKDGIRAMQNARQLGRQAATVGAVGGAAVTAAALKARLAKKDREIKEAQGAAAKAKLRADKEIINAETQKQIHTTSLKIVSVVFKSLPNIFDGISAKLRQETDKKYKCSLQSKDYKNEECNDQSIHYITFTKWVFTESS